MRLVSYTLDGEEAARVGVARDESPDAPILDLRAFARRLGAGSFLGSFLGSFHGRLGIRQLLERGAASLTRLSRAVRAQWKELDRDPKLSRRLTVEAASARLLPPIPDPEKIICIGQNYVDHCREQNVPLPASPIIFAKFRPALLGHGQAVRLPAVSKKVDFEAELAFVIGTGGRDIPREKAYRHVAGYMPFNDVSARDLQFADGQWVRGKSCDTFAPCGPALVTRDEVPDPQGLGIGLLLNEKPMQDSSTRNLIFDVPYLVSFLSQTITLRPGDIVSTGTPPGVGCFRKPPVFLQPGDTMTVWIEKLGRLTNPVT